MNTTYAKAKMQKLDNVFFSLLKMVKLYHAPKMHYTWVNLNLINCIKPTNWSKRGYKNQESTNKGRLGTLAWVHTMTKITVNSIKASDNQPLSKDRLEKQCPRPWSLIWTETLHPIIPNRPSYFNMQTENKPSKWTQELLKKHKVWSPKVFRQEA